MRLLQNNGVGGLGSEYVKECVIASLLFANDIKQLKEKEKK